MTSFLKISHRTATQPGLWKALFGVILASQLLTGCANIKQLTQGDSRMELTPVTSQPTGIHHPGKIVWHDLLTEDAAVASNFYGPLFGWTFRQQGRYTVVLHEGKEIAGIAEVKPKDNKKHAARWLLSMSVADVDQATSLVTSKGGTIHKGPLEMKNRGRGVLVSDPQGAPLTLIHSATGDPLDTEDDPAMGSWLWNELWSHDSTKSTDFYRQLAGYTSVEGGDDYWILMADDQWRAGIRAIANNLWNTQWVPTIRVANLQKILAQVKKLGGKVLIGERATASGSAAAIADPAGAILILQRWSDQIAEGEE